MAFDTANNTDAATRSADSSNIRHLSVSLTLGYSHEHSSKQNRYNVALGLSLECPALTLAVIKFFSASLVTHKDTMDTDERQRHTSTSASSMLIRPDDYTFVEHPLLF